MRSASNYSFAVAPSVQMPRSSFKRDRTYKTTFDSGYLVPFFMDEVYPGDTFNGRTTAFARLSTPIVPFMDNLHMDFFYFYVPYRILWDHWKNMNGEQKNPNDSTDYLTPIVNTPSGGFAVGSLADYFGMPVGVNDLKANVWLFRAYNKIYNDHFRDENLIDSVPENTGDGPDNPNDYKLLKRCKRHDFYTSCLPWPQKGPGASIGISGDAPVITGDRWSSDVIGTSKAMTFGYASNGAVPTVSRGLMNASGSLWPSTESPTSYGQQGLVPANLHADLSSATAITINSLRTAFQIQKLYEKDARGGTRYAEICRTHFGVFNPDSRLQRSEYIGGGTIPINIHSVAQTSSTNETTPQGNLAAYGVASGFAQFSKSFVEHGVIIGLVNVRADLTYQQGIDRAWTRRTRFDYYWPSLAHLGEQAILNKEIYAQGTSVDDDVFGYQERWAELRYGVSKITGKLRSGVAQSLDCWHLAQHFENLPTLSKDFIEENPPLARVLAVQDEPQIIFDSLTSVNTVRCLPAYSVPGLVDHF